MAKYYVDYDGSISTDKKKKKKNNYYVDESGKVTRETASDDDVAPVKKTSGGSFGTKKNNSEAKKPTWVDKGAFEDGYQFGDLSKTVVGTLHDVNENLTTAVVDATENLIDTTAYGVGAVGGLFNKGFKEDVGDFIAKEILKPKETGEVIATYGNPIGWVNLLVNDGKTEENSVLGDKADGLVQSGAHLVGTAALQAVGVPAWLTMGVNAFGGEIESAFQNDATYGEAGVSGAVSAVSEIVFEKLSGGIKFKGVALDDGLQKWLATNIKNKVGRTVAKYTTGMLGEGLEEVLTEFTSSIGKKLTYMDDKEFNEIMSSEDALDAFIGGALISGVAGGGQMISAKNKGVDYTSGLTDSEEKVVMKVYEDTIAEKEKGGSKLSASEKNKLYDSIVDQMSHGQLDIDTIESTLGGDAYKAYQDNIASEEALKTELNELRQMEYGKMNDIQRERLAELKAMNLEDTTKREGLRKQLNDTVFPLIDNSRLAESYNEIARRKEAFTADLSQYKGKQKEAVDRAIKSGVLNNTYRSHELVNILSKIEADKGITFDYTNNAKLKESGFAVEGKTVNGFVKDGGVTLNVQSSKAWQSTVGHEITHVLENTEAYGELQQALFKYAESKGELASRKAALTEAYKNIDADIDAELTADLVGDYLFTDKAFVDHLTGNRTLFQKIYDEIKYLCKVATGKELTEIEKVKREFDRAWKEYGKDTVQEAESNVKYSVSEEDYAKAVDSGDTETAQKMVDEAAKNAGYGIKAYHGTGYDFTVFDKSKQGDNYEDWGRLGKGFYFAPTSREAETWAELSRGGKNKVMPVYLRSENMLDSFEALPDNLKDTIPENWDSLTRRLAEKYAYNYIEYMQEFGYDVQKILTEKGYDGINGHTEFVVFDPEQVKSADTVTYDDKGNVIPLSERFNMANEDIRFSLSKAVEETKDLVALHNLTADKLTKSLELGGLPMPSLAITKSDIPHDNFGEITLIFDKKTIDPKANKKNKVYSADAWTPIFPRVEYEADSKVVNRASQKLRELEGMVDDEFRNDLSRIGYSIEDYLNRMGGEEGLIRHVMDNYGLKAAYLEDIGKHIEKVTKQEEVPRNFNPASADKYEKIMDILGVKTLEEIYEVNLKEARDNHGAELEAVFPGITHSALRMGKVIGMVGSYVKGKDSAPEYRTVTDSAATRKAVDDAIDAEGFEAWVRNLFSGVVKDSGIYNNKDLFTPSGNRRSFKQTHLPVTLENIVKAMASQNGGNAKNVSSFNGVKTLRASTAETFKSIDDMHRRKDRLKHLTQEEADAITEGLQNRLLEVMSTIDNENSQRGDSNHYIRLDQIGETISEIGENGKYGIADIQNTFSQYGRTISDDTAQAIKQLLYDVSQMPVNIFEAKPQRVVGFDEAKVFVIPNNVDANLKQELLNRGYSIAEYDPNVEGDRNRVVNQFEEYKFSLSNVGEGFAPTGNFSTPMKEVALEQDIAPVSTNTPTATTNTPTNTPTVETAEDIAPATAEEVEALNKASFDAITDEDAPPEMEAPYYGDTESVTTDDPFYDRDMKEVGSRKVKAYMYENPEVKPYFQAEAEVMLGDLYGSQKGERLINERMLYETNGEAGAVGIKRHTTPEIEELLDDWGYTYAEIEKGLKAIIEDNGKENNACSKRIEFMLHDHLMNGYQDFVTGYEIPANNEYVNLIKEKQITEYNEEAFNSYMASVGKNIDNIAPPVAESSTPFPDEIAPMTEEEAEAPAAEAPMAESVIDKPSFVSDKATSLYDEVKGMRKGVWVSRELGYLLDHLDLSEENKSESYSKLRTALLNIKYHPDQMVNENSAIESVARKMINDAYDETVYSTDELVAKRLKAVQDNIAKNKANKKEAYDSYEQQIAQKQAELDSKKNKNSGVANNLRMQIARLERLRDSTDAQYAKSIKTLEERAKKMQDPKYSRAMRKRAKMEADAKWAADLLGDTSTWKDKKIGLQYATNTERRNLRDIVRDENGNVDIDHADIIDDALNGQYNREQASKNRELAKVRGKYADMKLTKAEDAYIQMLGELRHNPDTKLTEEAVSEYFEKHKRKIDTAKVEKAIESARKDYDEFFERLNAELKKQGMKEIPYRKGYFSHFTEPKQNFIQKLLNWKTQDDEIPTSIAGLTETFRPTKSWQSFDKTRYSDETDYSFMKGFDAYADGALDWIYHMDTLQKRRAVENHIRFTHSDEGVKARIKEVYANEEVDADEAQAQIEHILSESKNPLNNFIQDFTTHTNILAGKKNSLDRTVEQWTNRHIYSVMTNVQNRMSANMVLANVRSALTNFIPITQSWAQVSPAQSLNAAKETIANSFKDDGTIDKSTFLTNRLREADKLYKTNWDKVLDTAGVMFEIVDNFSSQVIWRSKYNQNLKSGMSEVAAIQNADQFAENVMAGRSKGNEPTLFNAKNPFVKAFTMFQLEVNNQYGYLFKDVPNDLKAETKHWKFNLAKGYTTAFIGAYVYNALLEQVTGSDAALDPIGIVEDLLRDLGLFDDDEEKEPTEVATNLFDNVVEELPFVGGLFGGGRIPISSAMPYGGEYGGGVKGFIEDVGNIGDGGLKNIGKEMMNPALNVGLPVGGGQIKKTYQGLNMFSDDHPVSGSYTDSGNLRFPVEDTPLNRVQAGIFGQYASENAREYFDNGYAPLKEKQIQEYIDVDIPINDYWDYREGLKEQDTLEEKFDYVAGLDLPVEKKNILINNIVDRKEDVDLEGYEDFADYEEFDFAIKNPEKWDFMQTNNISYDEYNASEESRKAYNWAYNNPEGYALSKVVTDDVVTYRQYTKDLYDIKADKDATGKSISGSRKTKVLNYINNMSADYYTKIILFKTEYPSDDTYNGEIIEYINGRTDISDNEKLAIYTELGFRVANGYVYWD